MDVRVIIEALNVFSRDNYTQDFDHFTPDYIEKARFAIKASLIEWMTHKVNGDVLEILTHLVGTYPLILPQGEIDYEVRHILSLLNEEHKSLAQAVCFASDWKNRHKFSTTEDGVILEIPASQSLLKNRSRESVKPDFSEIAKHEAKQGNIEGALDAASHINERLTKHAQTLEYIADILEERGEAERAMKIMQKSGKFHYYPGKVALQLAKREEIEEAITMAKSIEANRYPQHRDAAFAAIALVMARQGKTEQALSIAEQYIKGKNLQNITKNSIEKTATLPDPDKELKEVVARGWSGYYVEPLLQEKYPDEYCLDLLYKSIIKYGLGLAFN